MMHESAYRWVLLAAVALVGDVGCFTVPTTTTTRLSLSSSSSSSSTLFRRRGRAFPARSLRLRASDDDDDDLTHEVVAAWWATTVGILSLPDAAVAKGLSQGSFNPDNFKPVCATSDGFYRFLQATTQTVVGEEQFVEYGPLIAGGLLRVRLELCVVESFFNEAVGPFIQQNGLSWILPFHETVETFLAGTIFALATTFILVGSTKIISVIAVYGDVFLGGPCRLFGGFFFDRARGKPVTLDVGIGPWKKRLVGPALVRTSTGDGSSGSATTNNNNEGDDDWEDIWGSLQKVDVKAVPLVVVSGGVKSVGEVSKLLRDVTEGIDTFIGRYLVLIATGYIGIKFIHFKVFPDFPPF